MKFKSKAIIGIMLTALLSVSSGAAFSKTEVYTDGQFADVPASEWYAAEVKSTFELGLMKGTGDTTFNPNGNVTVAEAITMAARAASIYAGEKIPAAGGEWYQMYVNYAKTKGFVTDGQFDNYDRPAKRYEVASLFENAMPEGYFAAKNNVTDIHDIPDSRSYKSDLLNLYKAGVVMGSDSFGTFNPEDNIIRAEAAAIINRVALPENRLSKTLDKVITDDAYTFIKTPSFNGANSSGIFSGWALDNRGGLPRNSLTAPYGALIDIRDDAGTALIREFNKTSTGKVDLYAKLTSSGEDGAYLEFRNDKDASVYRAEVKNGNWMLKTASSDVLLYTVTEGETSFHFNIVLDIDNNKATTYINDKPCGTHSTLTTGEATNILNFRIGTTEESKAVVSVTTVNAYNNYALFEDFSESSDNETPKHWSIGEGAQVLGTTLKLTKGSASATFDAAAGNKVITEFEVLLPEKEAITYNVMSGSKCLLTFTTDENHMYANGTKVYDNYYANVWYRMRFELDIDKQVILVKLNGRKISEVPFKQAATSVNKIYIENKSETTVTADDFTVFKYIEHEDYVPVPVIPEGADDYNIGINVCSLWKNGATANSQWSNISSFSDREPVIGYYDEGLAETADWEIKFLLEHGVDFQAFCVFLPSLYSPIRLGDDALAAQLFDGFMNAKYSDMAKYCMLWEANSLGVPTTIQQMDDYVVPFVVENFFKDPRYMVIDNQPVICIFSVGNISKNMGSNENAKAALDRLEVAAKELGFDGVLFLATSASSKSLAEMGIDGSYAYSWGTEGNKASVNIDSITASAAEGSVYTVPTVSVGFNSVAWHGVRYPLISMSDYETAHKWVRDEYLPANAKEDWQKNFVMISTWNEHGEGTYIMPSTDEKGFGYLDVIRDVYTKGGKNDPQANLVPTEAQKYRINHLYPQYRKVLRKEGYITSGATEKPIEELSIAYLIDYTQIQASDETVWDTGAKKTTEEGICGKTQVDSSVVVQNLEETIGGSFTPNLETITAVKVTAKLSEGSVMELYYTTEEENNFAASRMARFPAATTDEWTDYVINVKWQGKLKGFRIDPSREPGDDFIIKSVEFLTDDTSASRTISINGEQFEQNFTPEITSNGNVLVAFDPTTAIDFRLNCYYQWFKDTGVLKLDFVGTSMEFTVGSSKYKVDGVEKDLGYNIKTIDSLPLVPIDIICNAVGYTYELNSDNMVVINTGFMLPGADESSRVVGEWEFETIGDTESWSSTFMSLITYNGFMSCASMSDSNDPVIYYGKKLNVPAAQYKEFEIKVRYKYDSTSAKTMQLFFATDKSSGMSEDKSIAIKLNSKDSGNNFEVYRYNLKELATWKDTITSLRFDPFNAKGSMDIEYMRFIPDPDYDPVKIAEEEARREAEELANAREYPVPEIGLEHETYGTLIWYQDFEEAPYDDALYAKKGLKFTSGAVTGSVEITESPDNSGKALKVTPNGAHGGYGINFPKKLTEKGTYTFIADYYLTDGSAADAWFRWETLKDGARSDPSTWKSETYIKAFDAWNTYTDPIVIDDSTTQIADFSARKNKAEVYWLDNVKIYFMPAE